MEVFVAYLRDDPFEVLKDTLEAWAECDNCDPIAIQVQKRGKYELARRIAADNLSKGSYYILANMGCVPVSKDTVTEAESRMKFAPAGLAGLFNDFDKSFAEFPTGVRVCEKGAVKKWVDKRTETYDREHAESVVQAGKRVILWPDIAYKHLRAC